MSIIISYVNNNFLCQDLSAQVLTHILKFKIQKNYIIKYLYMNMYKKLPAFAPPSADR